MTMVADLVAYLDAFAPPNLAGEWDNVGLLMGDKKRQVNRVMTCLTVTPSSAAEAVERGADLIVTHHPILFRAVKRLTSDTVEGQMVLNLSSARIAVYSPHTAFDNCPGGINDQLATTLGLTNVRPLRARASANKQVKVVVFLPESDLSRLSAAVFATGAGVIGEYRECSYRVTGTGTYFGSDASNPALGQKGRREEASEWRWEVVCPEAKLPAVLQAIRQNHSYETPAVDVYPLSPLPGPGEGRIGRLTQGMTLGELGRLARERLRGGPMGLVGDPDKPVSTLALACGAAGEFLADAARAGAEAFLTGEARFHECLDAEARGVGLLLAGHHATERPGVEALAQRLKEHFAGLEVWASDREADPIRWL